MRPIGLALCVLAVLSHSVSISAYEIDTHEKLSIDAFSASNLQQDPDVQGNLGLTASDKFPGSDGIQKSIIQLIGDGAKFEDTLSGGRPINHFFNPLNGAPLTILGVKLGETSPDWATEDKGQITGGVVIPKQEFSYRDARQYFYDALTQTDKTKREENFGRTFQTMGHIIHHVQDMAQPQHVRNDQHLELQTAAELELCLPLGFGGIGRGAACAAYFAFKNPSLYEAYTNLPDVRRILPTNFSQVGYDINDSKFVARFNKPRNFWETAAGEGMAQFTNFNFVSAGTNFDNPGIFNFPLFTPTLRSDIDIQDLCANAMIPCDNPNLKGKMTFYGNVVDDRYTGQKRLNPLASTNSIFDADLLKANAKQSFTLNRFNFEVGYGFLIPRAVAYSAGLINYFFRGKIDVEQDPANNGKFVIRNQGPEAMAGSFGLYYDAVDDKRYPLGASTLSAAAGQITNGIALPPIPDDLPKAKTPGEYMLAFRGDMGEEKASTQTIGAVSGKVFYDPYLIGLRRVAFFAYPADPNNPSQTYGFFGSLSQNFALGSLVAQTTETFRLVVNDKTYPCFVFQKELVYCYNTSNYPYEEFYFDPTGAYYSSGVPQIEWNNSLSPSGKITLYLGDAVFFSLTYAAEALQDYAAVSFPKSFRWDTSRAVSITSGFVDR